MTRVIFMVDDSMMDVAKSAGIPTALTDRPHDPCPFMVGDTVTWPESRLAFRVSSRWYALGSDGKPPTWYLTLEQTPHPLATPEPGAPRER